MNRVLSFLGPFTVSTELSIVSEQPSGTLRPTNYGKAHPLAVSGVLAVSLQFRRLKSPAIVAEFEKVALGVEDG